MQSFGDEKLTRGCKGSGSLESEVEGCQSSVQPIVPQARKEIFTLKCPVTKLNFLLSEAQLLSTVIINMK